MFQSTELAEQMNTKHKEAIVVVDPFSTAILLCKTALEQGITVLVVITRSARMWENFRLSLEDIDATVVIEAKQPEGAAELVAAKAVELGALVKQVLPGGDASYIFAEQMARYLSLPTQVSGMEAVRCSKSAANNRLQQLGLNHIRTWEITNSDEIWGNPDYQDLKKTLQHEGIVAKPPDSSGTDKVFLCQSRTGLSRAIDKILNEETLYVRRSERALAQERISGSEYAFNTISKRGHHKVVSWWLYQKQNQGMEHPLYRSTFSLDPSRDGAIHQWDALYQYCLNVLDGFGIREGATHIEIFMTVDGPVLCELNPRLPGGAAFWFDSERRAQGYNSIDAWLMACLPSRRREWKELPDIPPEQQVRYGVATMYHAGPSGTLEKLPCFNSLENLTTCRSVHPLVQAGDHIQVSTSLLDFPGMVLFEGPPNDVLSDILRANRMLWRKDWFSVTTNTEQTINQATSPTKPEIPAIAVVEPSSTTLLLQRRALEIGLYVVSVLTLPEKLWENDHASISDISSCELVRNDDVNEIIRQIDSLEIPLAGVFPGFEASSYVADQLNTHYGLSGNAASTVGLRTTKSGMQSGLMNAGLKHMRWVSIDNGASASAAISTLADQSVEQFVVQPDLDAGSHHVHSFTDPEAAAEFARQTLLHAKTLQESRVQRVVVRELVEGPQYTIHGVSHAGCHKVLGCWYYDRIWIDQVENGINFKTPFFVTIEEGLNRDLNLDRLATYTFNVLDAIGHQNGAFSIELIDDDGDSPILIEINPRLPGLEGVWIDLQQRGLGYNSLDIWLSTLAAPNAVNMLPRRFENIPTLPSTKTNFHWAIFFLSSHKEGEVRYLPESQELRTELPTLHTAHWYVDVGGALQHSRSLMEVPGYLVFAGQKAAVENDLRKAKAIETSLIEQLLR